MEPLARARSRSAGVTLLELLISAAVIAVALVAAASAVLGSADLVHRNSQTRAVTPILRSLLDEVRTTPFDQVDTAFGGVTRNVGSMPDAGRDVTATFEVTDVPTGDTRWLVRQVRVRLRWGGRGGESEVSAVTYVSDRYATAPAPTAGAGGGSR